MPADLVLYNAKVATNRVPSFVEAVAIEDSKIVATGAAGEIKPESDPHLRARENLVHVLLNHTDFVTIR